MKDSGVGLERLFRHDITWNRGGGGSWARLPYWCDISGQRTERRERIRFSINDIPRRNFSNVTILGIPTTHKEEGRSVRGFREDGGNSVYMNRRKDGHWRRKEQEKNQREMEVEGVGRGGEGLESYYGVPPQSEQ